MDLYSSQITNTFGGVNKQTFILKTTNVMSEIENKHFTREDQKREAALAKEQERIARKEAKRQQVVSMPSYRLMVKTSTYMDKYFLDPILGFILPAGVGDALSSLFAFPFVYYSLCVVKSIPLTLAVIYNILMDVLIGAIPFCIGDLLDVFKRSYIENLRLITGYIEDDKEIINKVNKKAFWTAVFIAVICWLIYLVISWAISLGTSAYNWISSWF